MEEVAEILNTNRRIVALKGVDPEIAAKEAYQTWRKSKGLGDSASNETSKARATVPQPSGTGMGGVKVWTLAEVQAFNKTFDPRNVEHRKVLAEIEKARKEGRIK